MPESGMTSCFLLEEPFPHWVVTKWGDGALPGLSWQGQALDRAVLRENIWLLLIWS